MRREFTFQDDEALYAASTEHIIKHSGLVTPDVDREPFVLPPTLYKLLKLITYTTIAAQATEVSMTATDSPSGSNPLEWFHMSVQRLVPPEPTGKFGARLSEISLWFNSQRDHSEHLQKGFRYHAWYRLYARGDELAGVKHEEFVANKNLVGTDNYENANNHTNNFTDADALSLRGLIAAYVARVNQPEV